MSMTFIALSKYEITDMVETLSATLAIVVGVAALVILLSWFTGRDSVLDAVREFRATITLCVAGGAMLGSLYFSEVANYIPCRFCWFQRIAMYPIAIIGLVSFIRRDTTARFYVLPIAAIGACISAWHYLIEWRPGLDSGSCAATGPSCTDIWFRSFGFLTLAGMALIGFITLIVVNAIPERVEE
jgi:disulfide bond formation protein DsbB